jgi:hypothetical protein
LPGEDSISKCWVRWRERFRDGDNAVLEIFSIAVNYIEKWLVNRLFSFTLRVILNTYPDIGYQISRHFERNNKYKYLQNRPGGEKVLSPADRKFFPRRKTQEEKSYMANPGIFLSYNGGMEYHTA